MDVLRHGDSGQGKTLNLLPCHEGVWPHPAFFSITVLDDTADGQGFGLYIDVWWELWRLPLKYQLIQDG